MELLQDISVWAGKTSLQAGLIAITLWLIHTRRKTKGFVGIQYLLGILIITRLCLPTTPSLTVHPMNWFSTAQWLESSSPNQPQHSTQPDAEATLQSLLSGSSFSEPIQPGEVSQSPIPMTWGNGLALIWALGCAFGIVRVLRAHRRHHALLKTCRPLNEPPLELMVNRLRQSLSIRQPVELLTSSQVGSAAVTGTCRPRLIVSPSFLNQLNNQQREHVLIHELIHIKRFDPLVNWISLVLQALHWFNPMVHWALRKFQQDRELICDAIAIKTLGESERKAYGETLIEILMSFKHQRSFPSLVPIISNKHEIKRRIMMISMNQSTQSRRPILLLAGIATVLAVTFTRPALVTAQSNANEANSFTAAVSSANVSLNLEHHSDHPGDSTRLKLQDVSSRASGQGVLVAPGKGKQMYNVHEIDATAFPSGGILLIDVAMGHGESAGSFDLFPEGVALPSGAPTGSVARAYDVSPGESRTMVYRFAKGGVFRLGASGNWFSEKGSTNEFQFEARAIPLNESSLPVASISTAHRVHFAKNPEGPMATLTLDPEGHQSITIDADQGEVLELVPHSGPAIVTSRTTLSPEKAKTILTKSKVLSVDVKPEGKVTTFRYIPNGQTKEVEGTIYYDFDTKKPGSEKPKVSN